MAPAYSLQRDFKPRHKKKKQNKKEFRGEDSYTERTPKIYRSSNVQLSTD
jgi:hypothetical protein